jgi:hypothetical protein
VLALVGQCHRDAFGRFLDTISDQVADARDLMAEIAMDARNGAAHLLGLADQRLALGGEILEQAADA